jgi:hypothetical protein
MFEGLFSALMTKIPANAFSGFSFQQVSNFNTQDPYRVCAGISGAQLAYFLPSSIAAFTGLCIGDIFPGAFQSITKAQLTAIPSLSFFGKRLI